MGFLEDHMVILRIYANENAPFKSFFCIDSELNFVTSTLSKSTKEEDQLKSLKVKSR